MGSCDNSSRQKPFVITHKTYNDWGGDKMPDCLCRFMFNYVHEFQDSCNRYNIGDTIK